MHKKIYYLLMTAGSFAIVIMLGIIVMLVASCSSFPPLTLPDRGLEVPPNTLCCIPDENAPLTSCGGWELCEFDSQGELI